MTAAFGPHDETVLVSISSEYPRAAKAELGRVTSGRPPERLADDLLRVERTSISELAAAALSGRLVFANQLTREVGVLEPAAVATLESATDSVVAVLADLLSTADGAVRVLAWSSGPNSLPFGPGNLAYRIVERLEAAGTDVRSRDQDWIAAIVLVEDRVHVGWSRSAEALSDWPRGQVRLARSQQQVSRAEFKLEELFMVFPGSVPKGRTALDLGASPGGWTRIIRTYGLRVTAVDPGDLDPAIVTDRQVQHARTTAGQFLASTADRYDLIVNDMRMDAVRTSSVMVDAHRRLEPGGHIIVTLKLGVRDPPAVLTQALEILARRYTIGFVRQLHHNRHEVTVVATPKE